MKAEPRRSRSSTFRQRAVVSSGGLLAFFCVMTGDTVILHHLIPHIPRFTAIWGSAVVQDLLHTPQFGVWGVSSWYMWEMMRELLMLKNAEDTWALAGFEMPNP